MFRSRRRTESAVDDGASPQRDSSANATAKATANASTDADGDDGQLTPEGTLEWVGADAVGSTGSAPAPPADSSGRTTAPSADDHERSDPARAATEGMWEVIRPAAIVPEHAARLVLVELARRDLSNGGEWQSEPQLWSRYDGPVTEDGSRDPELMGTIHVTYGTPTKYEITLYRVSITAAGVSEGWTVASLTDAALGFGGLTLAQCPRAIVNTPPTPFTY